MQKNNKIQHFILKSEFLKQSNTNTSHTGVNSEPIADREVIVSLTTYGKRLYDVYLTIESIMQGSLKPNKIVLWLQDDMKDVPLPYTLRNQMKRGLEVYYTKDIRSYKKLIPALRKYPESIIITVDDDVLYDIDLVDRLVQAYKSNPKVIHGCRMRKIGFDSKGVLLPYEKWTPVKNGSDLSVLNLCVGVGGVLYPAHCFTEEVFKEETFMELCPRADDLWFWAMAKLNGYNSSKVYTRDPSGNDHLVNTLVQDVGLVNSNVGKQGGNNVQFISLINGYPFIKKLIGFKG